MPAPRGPHEDAIPIDEKIPPLDQIDPHALGEEAVFEIGGVVHARAQQNRRGLRHRFRCDILQHVEKRRRIVVVGEHVVIVEERREHPLDHLPVLQHVADTRRRAGVVFQHEILAVGGADQVGAADVDVDSSRHIDANELASKEAALEHEPCRHHAVSQDVLLVVDIPEKEVQGVDSLRETCLDLPPFRGRNDSRYGVHRPHPFDPFLGAVDREAHAVLPHREIGHRLAAAKIVRAGLQEPLVERLIMRTNRGRVGIRPVKHFVVGSAELIGSEQVVLRGKRALRARTKGSGGGLRRRHPPFSLTKTPCSLLCDSPRGLPEQVSRHFQDEERIR